MKRWILLMLVACACPSKQASAPAAGSNAGSDVVAVTTNPTTCEGVRAKVEQLYRAEAQAKEPKRVEEAVADNTRMVMNDCAKDTAKVVPCLTKATTVAEIEKQCLAPIDDEGTEGESGKR